MTLFVTWNDLYRLTGRHTCTYIIYEKNISCVWCHFTAIHVNRHTYLHTCATQTQPLAQHWFFSCVLVLEQLGPSSSTSNYPDLYKPLFHPHIERLIPLPDHQTHHNLALSLLSDQLLSASLFIPVKPTSDANPFLCIKGFSGKIKRDGLKWKKGEHLQAWWTCSTLCHS